MKKITILGGGNVAYHFAKKIAELPHFVLSQMYNRRDFSSHFNAIKTEKIHDLAHIKPADLYIICIKDEEISSFSEKLPFENQFVIHTSGNTDMLALNSKNRRGVLYPVQSFSKDKELNFNEIAFCIEAENKTDELFLAEFAQLFSEKIYKMDSQQRKFLHIAAVFLNNFANHIWYLSEEICKKNNIPFDILKPLLSETYTKTQHLSFFEAQTGPARRGDMPTIQKHLDLLENNEKEIYKTLTSSIINTYGK
ncbi:MAG: DUF2520 domain-containing protein [Capnocytophaga sp.]|nr:DUF2520 domain-containing protein [Capnocytophaga sp.]